MSAEFQLGEMWEKADTMRWLNEAVASMHWHEKLVWPHRDGGVRPVRPVHDYLKGGYGKWLAECPVFPGLFELIHRLIVNWEGGARKPQPEELLVELERIERERAGQGALF